MKCAVVSDLHIGRSDTNNNEDILDEFLDWSAKEMDKLYLIGDTFDFWHSNIEKIEKDHKKIFDKLLDLYLSEKIEATHGNHDWVLKGYLNLPNYLVIPDTKVALTHGHIWDPFTRYNMQRTERVIGIVFKKFFEVDARLEEVFQEVKKYFNSYFNGSEDGSARFYSDSMVKKGRFADYIGDAVEFAKEKRFDAVIYGHTHHSGKIAKRDKPYIIHSGTGMQGDWVLVEDYSPGQLRMCFLNMKNNPRIPAFDPGDPNQLVIKNSAAQRWRI